MVDEFIARNLIKTTEFLWRIGMLDADECVQVRSSARMQISFEYQRAGEYLRAWSVLTCGSSEKYRNNMVFCTCCDSIRNFVRNYSLLEHYKRKGSRFTEVEEVEEGYECRGDSVVENGFMWDGFCEYLVGVECGDAKKLCEVLEVMPLFWEGYIALMEVEGDCYVSSPLHKYFVMLRKVKKDIGGSVEELVGGMAWEDLNLAGAFLHACGEEEKSMEAFQKVFFGLRPAKSYEYVEVYAQMLRVSGKKCELGRLLQICDNEWGGTAEFYAVRGISQMGDDEFIQAIGSFKKSLRLREDSNVECLLGHSYAQIEKKGEAENCFYRALKGNEKNYRILQGVAHGFFVLGENEVGLRYAQKALGICEDGQAWKLVGRFYIQLEQNELALRALARAEQLGIKDALLYMAEVYRKMNRPEAVIELYEKYLKVGKHNREAVIKYLFNYYQEVGEMDKSLLYKEML